MCSPAAIISDKAGAVGAGMGAPLRKPFLRIQTAEEVHQEHLDLFRNATLVRDAKAPLMMFSGGPYPSALPPGQARSVFASQLVEIARGLMINEAQLYTLSLAYALVISAGSVFPGVDPLFANRVASMYNHTRQLLCGAKEDLRERNHSFLSGKIYDDSDKLLQVHTKTALLLEAEERKRLGEIERSTDISIYVLPHTVVRKGRQECRYLLLLPNGSQKSAGRRVKGAIQKIKAVSAEVKTNTNEKGGSSGDASPHGLSPALSPFQDPVESNGLDPEALALGMLDVSFEDFIPKDIFKEVVIGDSYFGREVGHAVVDYSSIYSGGLFPGRPSKRARVNHLRFLLVVDDFSRIMRTLRPDLPKMTMQFATKKIFFTYVKNSRSSERFRETLMDALDTVDQWGYEGCEKGQGTSETISPAALTYLKQTHSNIVSTTPAEELKKQRIYLFTCDAIQVGQSQDRSKQNHLCREVLACLKDNIGVTICTWRNSINLNLYGSIKSHYADLLTIVYLEDILKISDFMDFY